MKVQAGVHQIFEAGWSRCAHEKHRGLPLVLGLRELSFEHQAGSMTSGSWPLKYNSTVPHDAGDGSKVPFFAMGMDELEGGGARKVRDRPVLTT